MQGTDRVVEAAPGGAQELCRNDLDTTRAHPHHTNAVADCPDRAADVPTDRFSRGTRKQGRDRGTTLEQTSHCLPCTVLSSSEI